MGSFDLRPDRPACCQKLAMLPGNPRCSVASMWPDIDPELKRVRHRHATKLAPEEISLDPPPVLRDVAATVHADGVRELRRRLVEHLARAREHHFAELLRLAEGDAAEAVLDHLGEQVGDLLHRARPPLLRPGHRRVPQQEVLGAAGAPVGVDELDVVELGELHDVLLGVRQCRRAEDELGMAAVDIRSDALQPPQDECGVAAEGALVGMRLVDDDVLEVG
ncbi:hypothetical protein SEVIR_1G114201v4 [Setaria viridis]